MRFVFFASLFFALFASPSAFANDPIEAWVARSRELKLESDIRWRKLGHYRRTATSGWESFVDSRDFFLSDDGKSSPRAELEATIRGLLAPAVSEEDKHPYCRFPARYEFLKAALDIPTEAFPKLSCPGWSGFRDRVKAKSVTLVFSSFYVNNPSSAFGHVLLKLNSSDAGAQGSDRQLLDQGINFAASVDSGNPLVYAFKGVFGFFAGTYTAIPYYYKVREYNDFESRDLWEYDLQMTQAEVDRLVAHTWEVGPTNTHYFYMDENCATHIVTLLDAAVPDRKLYEALPFGVILPTDGLRAIASSPGFVKAVLYRPSIRTQFFGRLQKLDSDQRRLVAHFLDDLEFPTPMPQLSTPKLAQAYDAAVDGLDFAYAREFLLDTGGPKDFKQKILLARARTGVVGSPIIWSERENAEPHRGHDTSRAQFLAGFDRGRRPFVDLSYRVGLHDTLDNSLGYFDQATVEFGTGTLRIRENETGGRPKIEIEELILMRVASFIDFNEFQRKLSWRFQIGGNRYRAPLCERCLGLQTEGGFGLTFRLASGLPLFAYTMFEGDMGLGRFDRGDLAAGIGPRLGVRVGLGQSVNWLTEGYFRWYFYPTFREASFGQSRLRWTFATNWAADLGARFWQVDREAFAGLSAYF